mmetsp:Transcript_14497/g.38770  ORF Transcript_14497/g.38770 Transcript_14497/m.38770 type:complete len:418 (+) Transcript_14497:322-1575(+)
MGAKRNRARKKKNKKCGKSAATSGSDETTQRDMNFVATGAPGCHVAFGNARWVVAVDEWVREEWCDGDESGDDNEQDAPLALPDISIDPKTRLLTLLNTDAACARVFYVTLMHVLLDARGRPLEAGYSRDADGRKTVCNTIVALLRPRSVMDVAYVSQSTRETAGRVALEDIELYSDVRPATTVFAPTYLNPDKDALSTELAALPQYAFPLLCGSRETQPSMISDASLTASSTPSPMIVPAVAAPTRYLCTQGFGGCLTHFLSKTQHAVDLSAPVGSLVVAAGAGVVHSVQHRHRAGGIDVRLLFGWNALMLRLDDGNFAEYVHIRHSSSRVRVGQRVEAGQVLCESGDVGFCPTPHLHFTVYASDASNADTIPFAFADKMSASAPSAPFVPVAGCWYDKSGRVSSPANSPRREDTA